MILKIEAEGTLTKPDLHDGYLTGIKIEGNSTLTLFCKTVEGVSCNLAIPSLVKLRVNNFFEGNIIFEINLYKGVTCPARLVKSLYGYDDSQASQYLSHHIRDIHEKNWILIELISSYGCELLALAASLISDITVDMLIT